MIDMDNAEPGQEGELFDLKPYDYEMSFSDISFVPDKPCHQIVLYYMCQVTNELNEENDERENL
jgi:hypothetical protein